jgi:DNA-binding response OmpR family regulator
MRGPWGEARNDGDIILGTMERPVRSQILSVSYDQLLLKTRHLLLESRGYDVISAEGLEEAIAKCRSASYDLLIIGHSVPATDKQALMEESKRHCKSPILALLRPGEREIKGASRSLDATYHPDSLLLMVEDLLTH